MSNSIQSTFIRSGQSLAGLTVVHVVEGSQGGVGTAVRDLIEAQSRDSGIREVHLVTDRRRMGDMLHAVPARIHEYRSTRSPFGLLHVSRSLQRQLRSIAPDVVYLHSSFPGLYGRLQLRRQATPWVTVYCAHGWAFTQQISFAARKLYMLVERTLARHTDAIVSISYSEFDAAVRANVTGPLHRVIYHGVPGRKEVVPAPVPVDPDRLNVAFIGRFDRQKGLDLLLHAFATPQLDHVTLWLIGGSTLHHKYAIPEQSNVKLIGWVPNSQIDSYIQCFDAVIVPSRWEGFGIIALEAMRNGKPVLASRTGGLAELVIDGVNGRLFNPGDLDGLQRLLREISKADLIRMGKLAFDIFHAGFELPGCYARWSALTHDALALRAKPPRSQVAVSYIDSVTVQPEGIMSAPSSWWRSKLSTKTYLRTAVPPNHRG
jgi:glycosyltransferase involved in cell wall biosynthesis